MITGHVATGDYAALRDSWQRTLVAENKAPRTISTYLAAADELGSFLAERGMPTVMANLRREQDASGRLEISIHVEPLRRERRRRAS